MEQIHSQQHYNVVNTSNLGSTLTNPPACIATKSDSHLPGGIVEEPPQST